MIRTLPAEAPGGDNHEKLPRAEAPRGEGTTMTNSEKKKSGPAARKCGETLALMEDFERRAERGSQT